MTVPQTIPFDPAAVAQKIARGHAYKKHVVDKKEFADPKFGKSIAIASEQDFARHILKVMTHPRTRSFRGSNDKQYFHNRSLRTVVVYDPHNRQDNGTCFRPVAGAKALRTFLDVCIQKNARFTVVPKAGADLARPQAYFPAEGIYGHYPSARPVRQEQQHRVHKDRMPSAHGRNGKPAR